MTLVDLKKAIIDRWKNEKKKKAVYWWVRSKFRD